MSSSSPLSPTFHGHIASTQDALILFEACLNGTMSHVARRPHDRERASLIKSGNVFIYEEHSSGIKRWTDGVPWSPSRILGNFLVYRELERPFPPGEKKRAMKRSKKSPGISKSDPYGGSSSAISNGYNTAAAVASGFESSSGNPLSKETERSLIGSLVDSYGFKEDGLVKKTVSVTVGPVSHHLVSYYTVADVMNNRLTTPSKDPSLQRISPRADLVTKQNFRTPIDEVESLDRMDDRSQFTSHYSFARNAYEMTNQSMIHRPIPIQTTPVTYGAPLYNTYAMHHPPVSYDSLAQSHPVASFGPPYPPTSMYSAPKPEGYDMNAYRPQRYNSVAGSGAEIQRSSMPHLSAQFSRRTSNYEQGSSVDGNLSAISTGPMKSEIAGDNYHAQGFYQNSREAEGPPSHHYDAQRSLPTPTQQTGYERPLTNNPYTPTESKESIWPVGGSSNHSNYNPQHWAGAGTS